MAPYTLYPSKTLQNLGHLSDGVHKRGLMVQSTEMCGDACAVVSGDASDANPDKIFTQFRPFLETLDRHGAIATSTQSGSPNALVTSPAAPNQSTAGHLNSSAVVCITLAFVSVLLGLGAMALTRSRWYKRKKETPDGQKAPLPEIRLEPLEVDSEVPESVEEEKRAVVEEEDSEGSQESCFWEQTCASSVTSVESEIEEWEERGEVHRAQTQSVEIKRAILISVPAK